MHNTLNAYHIVSIVKCDYLSHSFSHSRPVRSERASVEKENEVIKEMDGN